MGRLWLTVVVLSAGSALAGEAVVERSIPRPDGNLAGVFWEGQVVTAAVPQEAASAATQWRVLDDRANPVRSGTRVSSVSTVELGTLGIGWYRVEFLGQGDETLAWTTAAVLAKPAAPVPQDSPICLDSAAAWFARDDRDKQDRLALLASMAGTNWVRDRLRWRD
ncbi:MAG: hypothetical protein ABFE01_22090, partial [Phycisphaerales bacterium]